MLKADIVVQGSIEGVLDFPAIGRHAAYQSFTIVVEKVLRGTVPAKFTAKLKYFTDQSLHHSRDTYIIALTKAKRAVTLTSAEKPDGRLAAEPEPPTVLPATCRSFLFKSDSPYGRTVSEIFDGQGDPAYKAKAAGSISGDRF